MADVLIEDCLIQIFEFLTPMDWIRASEVCTSWKTAALGMWRRFGTKISITNKAPDGNEILEMISIVEARKLVLQLSPVAKSLSDECYSSHEIVFINIGSFVYQIKFASHEQVLKLFGHNLTKLTKLSLSELTGISSNELARKALTALLSRNKITQLHYITLHYINFNVVRENNAAEKIEELELEFNNIGDYGSIQWHYPNLQKLQLTIWTHHNGETERFLSLILPFITTNLKSFVLNVLNDGGTFQVDLASDLFKNFFKLRQLEQFEMHYRNAEILSLDYFFTELGSYCRNLQLVDTYPTPLSDSTVFTLMTLPTLKSISVKPMPGFCPTDFPEMKKIRQFSLYFDDSNAPSNYSCTAIVNMLKKMTNLGLLQLLKCRRSVNDEDQGVVHEQITKIIYKVLKAFPTKRVDIMSKLNVTISSATKEHLYETVVRRTDYENGRFLHDRSETLYVMVNYTDFKKFSTDLELHLASKNI